MDVRKEQKVSGESAAINLVIFFIQIFTMVIQPTLMFLFEVSSILGFCHIQPSLLGSQLEKDAWHMTLVEAGGGEFLPLVVDNFGIWTPSSVEILHSIAWISTVRNELSTGMAFCHLVERLSVQLYHYNAK